MTGRTGVSSGKTCSGLVCIRPKVSVLIVTYNQHEWIAQAVESALAQKVDFDIEIVIGDDFSTDGTREIVESYAARYPGVIRLNRQDRRPEGIPGRVNQVTTLEACRGEFIAFLDGDDFWTDPGKLAHQVDLLEATPGIVGVAHDALILHEGGSQDRKICFSGLAFEDHGGATRVGLRDIIVSPAFQTSTWMVRSECVRPLPDWYNRIPAADWGLFAIAAFHGDMLVEQVARSVYRRHGRSILAQLINARTSERSRWHQQSFQMIASAFPNAERTARWRLVHARSKLNEAVEQRRLLRTVIRFAVLFGTHDRKRLIGMISRPRMLAERISSTLHRLFQSSTG
jgi:glycosyltransferase involved in cell wall biosynthesis